jgi:HTH-type transcriptional repressor of NAD biosynthesis genes
MDFGPEIETYQGKTIGMYGGKFLPLHRGHVSFILQAQAMVDVLFVVVNYDPVWEGQLCKNTRFDYVGPRVRERWLAEEFKDYPNIRVVSAYEHRSEDYMHDDTIFDAYAELQAQIGHIDVVFSGEDSYTEYFAKYLPEARHAVFFQDRPIVNISATKVREMGPYAAWDYLPRPVQTHYVKRLALCGVESVGKTFLSRMVATSFNTITAPEWGRLYYEELNAYTDVAEKADFVEIATGHCHRLDRLQREAQKLLSVDTDMVYTQWFYMQEYGEKNPVLDALIRARADKIDRYVYIEPYNAHELDGTRLPVDETRRRANNESLKALYREYGIELTIVDEPDREKRSAEVLRLAQELVA